jgi:hypothetical protein
MKNKKCIKCGILIHQTDWIILKQLSLLPICDNCSLESIEKDNIYISVKNQTNLIRFPKK